MKNEWNRIMTSSRRKKTMGHTKVYLTASIIIIGVILGAVIASTANSSTLSKANGILIDFEEYDVTWFSYDTNQCSDPVQLLEKACTSKSYTFTFSDGILTEVNGRTNDADHKWSLWYVKNNETAWTKSDTYDIKVTGYSAVAWAYRSEGDVPTVAVDSTGTCVYGYNQATKLVTLSPVATETVGSLKAASLIIGTDFYSNYPTSVMTGRDSGRISIVGTYTDPSYEKIVKCNPNMVIADGSQYNQIQVSKNVRNSGINAVTIYDGEDIHTIYNNLYIIGVAIGYELTAKEVINNDAEGLSKVSKSIDATVGAKKNVMVALSPDASPYVAGNYTYVNDILNNISANNSFDSAKGWAKINTEKIAENNPDVIVIVTESYQPTQSEWDNMYNNLPDTWKRTKAYEDKQIYLVCGKCADLASRSSPRFPQFAELLGEIIYPKSFGMESMPKYIGDDYTDYLTITKYLGYDN